MLVELLEQEAVPFETLHTLYGSLLELVRRIISVVPNSVPTSRSGRRPFARTT